MLIETLQRGVVAILVGAIALAPGESPGFWGETDNGDVTVGAEDISGGASAQGADGGSSGARIEERIAAPACIYVWLRVDGGYGCTDPVYEVAAFCADGTPALDPIWMRFRIGSGPWSVWTMITWYRCPGETARETAIREAWGTMPIRANTITVQPATGWTVTTVPTIVYVDRGPRTLSVNLLGTPVLIRANASAYTWQWGDGSPATITGSPGSAYPNHDVTHTYMYEERLVTISLTTSWTGQYSTDGGATWSAAPGTAYTASTPVDIYVYNPHSHQVNCDITEYCLTDP